MSSWNFGSANIILMKVTKLVECGMFCILESQKSFSSFLSYYFNYKQLLEYIGTYWNTNLKRNINLINRNINLTDIPSIIMNIYRK